MGEGVCVCVWLCVECVVVCGMCALSVTCVSVVCVYTYVLVCVAVQLIQPLSKIPALVGWALGLLCFLLTSFSQHLALGGSLP